MNGRSAIAVQMQCDRCGATFRGDPQNQPKGEAYCSLACERDEREVQASSPHSPQFPAHLQDNPEALVGRTLVTSTAEGSSIIGEVTRYFPHADTYDVVRNEIRRDQPTINQHIPRPAVIEKLEEGFDHRTAETGSWAGAPGCWWTE